MPAPYGRRDPLQGVARAANRGAKGQAQGRFSGLSRVQPGQSDTPTPRDTSSLTGWVYANGLQMLASVIAGSYPGGGADRVTVAWTPRSDISWVTVLADRVKFNTPGLYSMWANVQTGITVADTAKINAQWALPNGIFTRPIAPLQTISTSRDYDEYATFATTADNLSYIRLLLGGDASFTWSTIVVSIKPIFFA